MKTVKLKSSGKVILKDGKVSCACCGENYEMAIKYDWVGTGMRDLDTKTTAFGESVGWACGGGFGLYVLWLAGGNGNTDDTSENGFERVDVRVDKARSSGLWTSSYNIECHAGWYKPSGGSGSATLEVIYKGKTKTLGIQPGEQDSCASTSVATITVYAAKQPDGTYFEIL
jgi:hypothetical protein